MKHANLIHLSPSDLVAHAGHIQIPLSHARFETLKASISRNGIQRPLAVIPAAEGGKYALLAGYNRWSCALQIELPCVPCVILADLDDPLRYMLDDNVTSRPCTKSAIALQVFLYHRWHLLATDPEARQVSGLKRGPVGIESQRRNIGVSCNSLADEYDFDKHLLFDLIEMYRSCEMAETPEGASENAEGEDAWGAICRAILEDETSIPRLKAGLGGMQTKGQKKAAVKYDSLGIRSSTSLVTVFSHWSKVPAVSREAIAGRFQEALRALPPEGFDCLAFAMDSWNDHECKRLQAALRSRLARK